MFLDTLHARLGQSSVDLASAQELLGHELYEIGGHLGEAKEQEHNFHLRHRVNYGLSYKIWTSYIFHQNRPMLIKVMIGVILSVIYKVADKFEIIEVDTLTPIYWQVLGYGLSLLLVFQINECYHRFMNARTILDSISVNMFDLLRQVIAYSVDKTIQNEDAKKAAQTSKVHLIRCSHAFYYLMATKLRGQMKHKEMVESLLVQKILTVEEGVTLNKYPESQALVISAWLSSDIHMLQQTMSITEVEAMSMAERLEGVVNGYWEMMEIKGTQIPIVYTFLIKSVATVWCWTVSLTFVDSFEWSTPIWTFLLCFVFFSISSVSEELEDPFGVDLNDLPLGNLGKKMSNALRMLITEEMFPEIEEKGRQERLRKLEHRRIMTGVDP